MNSKQKARTALYSFYLYTLSIQPASSSLRSTFVLCLYTVESRWPTHAVHICVRGVAWRGVAWRGTYRIVSPSPYRIVPSVERESTVFEQDIKAEHSKEHTGRKGVVYVIEPDVRSLRCSFARIHEMHTRTHSYTYSTSCNHPVSSNNCTCFLC